MIIWIIERNNKKVNFKCQGLNVDSALIYFNIKSICYIGLIKYFLTEINIYNIILAEFN